MNEPLRNVDLNLLLALDVLAAEESVSRAARRFGVGQPAMSATLRRLRALFGDPLLVRSGRAMQLTARGEELARQARRVLEMTARLIEPAPAFDPQTAERTFQLALTIDDAHLLGAPLLRALAKEAPAVGVSIRHFGSQVSRRGEFGDTDLRILAGVRADPALPSVTLFRDRWSLVGCARTHRRTAVRTLADLGELAWVDVVPEVGDSMRHPSLAMRSFRGQVRVVAEVPSRLEAAFAVVNTPYVFAAPSRLAHCLQKTTPVRLIPFDQKVLPPKLWPRESRLVMQWTPMREHDEAHVWLRGLIRKVAAETRLTLSASP